MKLPEQMRASHSLSLGSTSEQRRQRSLEDFRSTKTLIAEGINFLISLASNPITSAINLILKSINLSMRFPCTQNLKNPVSPRK